MTDQPGRAPCLQKAVSFLISAIGSRQSCTPAAMYLVVAASLRMNNESV